MTLTKTGAVREPIRILLADDHAVLRAGLQALLAREADMRVVGEAADGAECLRIAAALEPDVILLDLNMPVMDGLETLEFLKAQTPAVRVLILTMHEDARFVRQVIELGGAGYVLKQAADQELLSAIRTVHSGGTYLHPEHASALIQPPEPASPAAEDEALARLSEREREVLTLVAFGHSNKEIAEQLVLSVKTVETYKARIMEKLDLRSRASLVRFALKHGLMSDDDEQ